WKKVKKGLSAGRVQSVALGLIIDRENEIKNFEPEEYWSITGEFEKAKKTFEAQFYGTPEKKLKLSNEDDVKAVLATMKGKDFLVKSV
ncbi:DNA topoisomerase, partial [Bacillus sp. SIMBA_161]